MPSPNRSRSQGVGSERLRIVTYAAKKNRWVTDLSASFGQRDMPTENVPTTVKRVYKPPKIPTLLVLNNSQVIGLARQYRGLKPKQAGNLPFRLRRRTAESLPHVFFAPRKQRAIDTATTDAPSCLTLQRSDF